MLILADNGDSLDVVLSVAADIDVHASWVNNNSGTITAGKENSSITASATIVSAPASGFTNVKTVNIRNKDTTDATDVTVRHVDSGGTTVELAKVTLQPGDLLQYVEGLGWDYIPVQTPADVVYRKLTADVSAFTTTTLGDVSGMALPVLSGYYYAFEFHLIHQAAATTTGLKLTVTVPAVTQFAAVVFGAVSTAADGTANIYYGHINSSGDAVVTTGTPGTGADHLTVVKGAIVPAANGNVQLQGASEVAASNITLQQGSLGRIERWS